MTTLPSTSSIRLPRPGGPGAQSLALPGTGLSQGPAGAHAGMTPADFWRVIRGSIIWIILSLLVAGMIGYGLYWYQKRTNPQYQAVGDIVLNRPTRLDAQARPEQIDTAYDLRIEQRTQTQMLMNQGLWQQVLEKNTRIRSTDWFKGFEAKVAGQSEATTSAALLARDELEDKFRVSPLNESKILRVSMTTRVPEDAREIIQAIVDAHIQEQQKNTIDRTSAELEAAKQWKDRYTRAIATARDTMNSLQARLNGGGSPLALSRLNIREMEISNLVAQQMSAKLEATQAAGQLEAIMAQIQAGNDPPQVNLMVDNDPSVQRLRQTVDTYDLELEPMRVTGGDKSKYFLDTKMRRDAARAKLEAAEAKTRAMARNQLVDTLKSNYQSKKSEDDNLAQQVDSRRTELGEISSQIAEYQTAKDELDTNRALEREMNERVAVLTSALRNQQPSVAWARTPIRPDTMSSPRWQVYVPMAMMIGLGLSVGLAFLKEIMDTSVRSPRDIARVGPMNLLGMIADESDDPQLTGVPLHMVISQAPHSIMAEQFRQVRTRLHHAASLDTTRTMVITSPGPQDGKSVVACNLAAGLALNGRRILLVDANFRRPELHKLFGVSNDVGFANVLDSLTNLETAVQKTSIPNLELLTTGPKAANPTELIESQLFSDFIDRSLEEYDHVIFDTGPLLVVSEAVALAPRVDGVITVVRAKSNSRGMLSRVKDTLKQIKAEHLGVVLNGVQNWGGGYYG
ncbi:MAG TPA: polysaccharide biosynthesis tyrosine autokinase, partial [Tepidisphaeraceae bacterium]